MKRLLNFITAAGERLRSSFGLRLLCYGLILAALVLVSLALQGEGVSFVYNEF